MGNDLTEALDWVTVSSFTLLPQPPAPLPPLTPARCQEHKEHISSLSITGYGPPGAKNISSLQFNQALKGMGIDTYSLWGGDWSSFSTPAAVNGSVAFVMSMLTSGGLTGVDLDFVRRRFPLLPPPPLLRGKQRPTVVVFAAGGRRSTLRPGVQTSRTRSTRASRRSCATSTPPSSARSPPRCTPRATR